MQPLLLLTLVSDVPKPENIWKKYTLPSYWKNIVLGRRAAKISKQHKSLEQRKKTDIDQIWQSQIKETVVSLRQVEMQYRVSKFDASSSKYDASLRGLS